MPESHPTHEVLDRFVVGDLTGHDARNVTRHLLAGCATCRGYLAEGDSPAADTTADGTISDEAWGRILTHLSAYEQQLRQERAVAPALLAELMEHEPPRRQLLVDNSPRFQTWALAELALAESERLVVHDREAALAHARLGLAISERLPADQPSPRILHDLKGRSWAVLGNAERLRSDFPAAETCFSEAREHLLQGTGDPLEEARYCCLLASFRSEQRRFEECDRLLERAVGIYTLLEETEQLGATLVRQGTVAGKAGRLDEAVDVLNQALTLLDESASPRLVLVAEHNLVLNLRELGRLEEALTHLREARRLHRELGNRLDLVRLRWLEGKLAMEVGQAFLAESAFSEVRGAFVAESMPFDAALASLDLALFYLEQGRPSDAKQLAVEMSSLFRNLGVGREAYAALLVLERAAVAERLTTELVRQVTSRVEKARDTAPAA